MLEDGRHEFRARRTGSDGTNIARVTTDLFGALIAAPVYITFFVREFIIVASWNVSEI